MNQSDSVRGLNRLGRLPWRRLSVWLVLALLLLFAQQGSLVHEMRHLTEPGTRQDSDEPHPGGQSCALCQAFAPIASAAKADRVMPDLLADLAFHAMPMVVAHAATAELPQRRSRGPPIAL